MEFMTEGPQPCFLSAASFNKYALREVAQLKDRNAGFEVTQDITVAMNELQSRTQPAPCKVPPGPVVNRGIAAPKSKTNNQKRAFWFCQLDAMHVSLILSILYSHEVL